jgi:hypothetical protein
MRASKGIAIGHPKAYPVMMEPITPTKTPERPPKRLNMTASPRNCSCMADVLAPTAIRKPLFLVLSSCSIALTTRFGSVSADSARGLALLIDNGPQYLSDHFQNQIKFWGIAPSFAFVAEPETNGVAERFYRTLKEQIIYGRHYQTI